VSALPSLLDMARGMARGLLLVCGVAALSWGGAFTGAPMAAHRSVDVARAAKKDGPFTPTVVGLKLVMGEEQLVKMRKYFITLHGDAQGAAIDTYESDMGKNIMAWFFDQADVDGNGTIDKEELLAACQKLGFNWITRSKPASS
jgi:hypothetical protein